MDYLEGLFLGKLWSDTDYENRRHMGLFIIYGFFVEALVLYCYFYGTHPLTIGSFGILQTVIFVILFLACPFINFRYYRMPLWGKLLVMVEKIFKSFLIISYTVSLILPRLTVKSGDLQDFIIGYLNNTLETYTVKFQSSAGSFSTVIGVLAGGLHVIVVIILLLAAAVVIPGIIYLIVKFFQWAYDWVVNTVFLKRFFPSRR